MHDVLVFFFFFFFFYFFFSWKCFRKKKNTNVLWFQKCYSKALSEKYIIHRCYDIIHCFHREKDNTIFQIGNTILAKSNEKVPSSMQKLRRFRSCACAKYHPDFCSPLEHSIASNDSVWGERMPRSDCANMQADMGLRCPHMPEDTFLYDMTLLLRSLCTSPKNRSFYTTVILTCRRNKYKQDISSKPNLI